MNDSGVERFVNEVYPPLKDHFSGLATVQQPSTLFVTCSDSRVDPSLITQTLPGELFVLRNVGNLIPAYGQDNDSAAVVEYALTALKVRRVVICGHSNCGAMYGLTHPEALAELPTVASWVAHAAEVRERVASLEGDAQWDAAIPLNVAQQMRALRTHPSVQRALAKGRLTIEGWVYDIGEGRIDSVSIVEQAEGVA